MRKITGFPALPKTETKAWRPTRRYSPSVRVPLAGQSKASTK